MHRVDWVWLAGGLAVLTIGLFLAIARLASPESAGQISTVPLTRTTAAPPAVAKPATKSSQNVEPPTKLSQNVEPATKPSQNVEPSTKPSQDPALVTTRVPLAQRPGDRSGFPPTRIPAYGPIAIRATGPPSIVCLNPERILPKDLTTTPASEWTILSLDLDATLTSVATVGNRIWAVGEDGLVITSSDGGRSWRRPRTNVSAALQGVVATSESSAWAFGDDGVVLRTGDGEAWGRPTGLIWDEPPLPTPTPGPAIKDGRLSPRTARPSQTFATRGFDKLVAGPDGQLWGVVDGDVLRSDDGTTWHLVRVAATGGAWVVDLVSPARDVLWLLGTESGAQTLYGQTIADAHAIVATSDGGRTWQSQSITTPSRLEGIGAASATVGWAVGPSSGGSVVIGTTDGARTWHEVAKLDASGRSYEHGMLGRPPLQAWMLRGGLWQTNDGGTSWTSLGPPFLCVWMAIARSVDRLWMVGSVSTMVSQGDRNGPRPANAMVAYRRLTSP